MLLLPHVFYYIVEPELAKLKLYTIVEQNGFVYLWFHAEDEEPNWQPPIIPEIQSGEWAYRGRSEFRVACHIQVSFCAVKRVSLTTTLARDS